MWGGDGIGRQIIGMGRKGAPMAIGRGEGDEGWWCGAELHARD